MAQFNYIVRTKDGTRQEDAIEADNKFLSEQDKIEPSEPIETPANQ